MSTLEYWFDFSCPYAYLASTQVEAVAARTGAVLRPEPLLLGGVFKALGVAPNLSATLGREKARHNAEDQRRCAARFGVPLNMPEGHPRRTVDALRALLAAGEPFMPLAHRFFHAYWVLGIDLGIRENIARILSDAGHDAEAVLLRAATPEIKEQLRRRTDQAIEKGVFGVPSFFVDGELYWGQDRLEYVEAALGGAPQWVPPLGDAPSLPTDFYFDYSSPFSYIAAERVEAMLGSSRFCSWKPMLLGGVFKAVSSPIVPFFTQGPAKQRHTRLDLARQAKRSNLPVAWPTRFPMNTVLALRVTLLSGTHRALVHRFFSAYWVEDKDLSDPATIALLSNEVGLDGSGLVARAAEQEAKDLLRAATDAAVAAGVFGAPTFVVHPGGAREPALYWGADRLDLAALAARGASHLL